MTSARSTQMPAGVWYPRTSLSRRYFFTWSCRSRKSSSLGWKSGDAWAACAAPSSRKAAATLAATFLLHTRNSRTTMTCKLLAGRLAQDRFERGDQGPAALQRLAELHSHGAAHGVRLFGQQAESRMAAVDLGIDTDAARDEGGLVGALAIDQQIAVQRGRSASR